MADRSIAIMSNEDLPVDAMLKSISAQTGLSAGEILKKVKELMSASKEPISLPDAARFVAEKLNVKLSRGKPSETARLLVEKLNVKLPPGKPATTSVEISEGIAAIKDLASGMKNVNIAGRVSKKFPPKEFTRKTGETGKIAAMIVDDGTGSVRVATWDKKTAALDAIVAGDVVGVYNASVKNGMNGAVEVNTDDRSAIKKNPGGIDASKFPAASAATPAIVARINDVTEGMKVVTITAKVIKKLETKEFIKNGKMGEVAKARVDDGSGSTIVIFWTERVPDCDALVQGNTYTFSNLTTKYSDFQRAMEFFANKETIITMASEG
jgi:hypothetical protein